MDEIEIKKKIIGERIKIIRNELGLTMNEFGKKFNPPASDSIVSRWERGISSPNNERLKKIAELGNISIFYLTTGKKTVSDLSIEERIAAGINMKEIIQKIANEQKEYLKDEFKKIKIEELDFTTTIFLTEMLNYLKWSDERDILNLTSILVTLNNSSENEDTTSNQDELKEYVYNELRVIEEFIKKRLSIDEGE